MGSQHHHQTKVSLTNLKVHLKKNYWYTGCGCRKTLITILLLVLVEKVQSDVKSFFSVFNTSNHISIYSDEIAQHNQFEHKCSTCSDLWDSKWRCARIASNQWHGFGKSLWCFLSIITWWLFLALCMGIPTNGFKRQNNMRSLRPCYHV